MQEYLSSYVRAAESESDSKPMEGTSTCTAGSIRPCARSPDGEVPQFAANCA